MIDPATGTYLSEDFAFCKRWTDIGGEIWADLESRSTMSGRRCSTATSPRNSRRRRGAADCGVRSSRNDASPHPACRLPKRSAAFPAFNGGLRDLFTPLDDLLACGGDPRLMLDPISRVNDYGCGPSPIAADLSFASSTASSISRARL